MIDVAADLEVVIASPLRDRLAEVVPQLDAALVELLGRRGAADADDTFIELADEVGIERRRIPVVLLPAQRRLVQGGVVVPLMAERRAVDPVLDVVGRLEGDRRVVAGPEVARLVLVTVVAAEIDELILRRLPAQLAKREVRLERAGEDADVLAEAAREGRIANRDRRRRVLVVSFIGEEVVELVLDDRAADREARLAAVVVLV